MEFFNKAKVIRLRSHLDKFLVADDDDRTVRQSRNGASIRARWAVETVDGKSHVIRLKSCASGRYLTPSDEPFAMRMTGKKVVQDVPANKRDTWVEWEPIRERGLVKLRAKGGRFLRGNGGAPPWRNSVTHDLPQRTATQDWVLWAVDVVDILVMETQEALGNELSPAASFTEESPPGPMCTNRSSYASGRQESLVSDLSAAASFSSLPNVERVMAESRAVSMGSNGSPYANGRQGGMEFFHRAKAVRLQSYHNKYLVADDDEETVRQSRNGSSTKARWTIEYIEGKSNVIRLKSCHGLYLSATNETFLLGMTGKKVQQHPTQVKPDHMTEWEPIKEGNHVKLRTSEGKFLRANGGTPPWRNSITHDVPHRTATQDWVLWGVDVVDISLSDTESVMSSLSSFSSVVDDYAGSPDAESRAVTFSSSGYGSQKQSSGMEFFRKAKSVRLKSHHDKYLLAGDDGEHVFQDRNGTTKKAMWTVEFVDDFENVVRLKSIYGRYLTAAEDPFILGLTGQKVVQSVPRNLDSSVEWEPIRDGFQVRLKTRYGNYLRANGGLPPWRNSITHDIPHRHHEWILWEVDTVEVRPDDEPPPEKVRAETINPDLRSPSFHLRTPKSDSSEGSDLEYGSKKKEGRMIYYRVVDDDGDVDGGETSFVFKGNGLEDLTLNLEERTGLEDIIVCSRSPLNGKLYPMRLSLPPNNATMHIVVVPSTSKVARGFLPSST